MPPREEGGAHLILVQGLVQETPARPRTSRSMQTKGWSARICVTSHSGVLESRFVAASPRALKPYRVHQFARPARTHPP